MHHNFGNFINKIENEDKTQYSPIFENLIIIVKQTREKTEYFAVEILYKLDPLTNWKHLRSK